MASRTSPRRFRSVIRWWFPGAVLFATVILVAWDQRLTRAPHLGWLPESTHVAFYSNDLPGLWRDWENLELRRVIRQSRRDPLGNLVLDLRRRSGVRWTPQRIRTWFGRAFLALQTERGEVAVCFRPGVLYRAAWLLGKRGDRFLADVLPGDAPIVSASREGFIILSRSGDLVDELKKARGAITAPVDAHPSLTISMPSRNGLWSRLTLDGDLQFTGHVDGDASESLALSSLGIDGASHDLIAVSGRNLGDWVDRVRAVDLQSPILSEYAEVLREFDRALPEGWAATSASFSLIVEELDVEGIRPLPRMAFVIDGPAAFEPQLPANAVPFEWSSAWGWLVPLQSHRFHAAFADNGAVHYFATSEPLMRRLAGLEVRRVPKTGADLSVRVRSSALSERMKRALYRAAEQELIAGYNREDLEASWDTAFEAVGHTAEFQIDVVADDAGWDFTGRLTAGVE